MHASPHTHPPAHTHTHTKQGTVADGSSDEEGEDRRASRDAKLDLQDKVFLALGRTWPTQASTQGVYMPITIIIIGQN